MDREIKQNSWSAKKLAPRLAGLVILVLLGLAAFSKMGNKRLKVQKSRIQIAEVQDEVFQELIAVTGQVEPLNTVFVPAIEGGQVQEVYVDGGEMVKKGDLILKLANPGVELNYMNLQTNLLEQADQLRNTKISLENSGLILEDQLIQLEQDLANITQQYDRNKSLLKDSVIAQQDFDQIANSFHFTKRRRKLMTKRIVRDSVLRGQQLGQVETSLNLVARNLNAIQRNMDNLTIKAPISGQLSAVRVEIGQTVQQGQAIGQIDVLDGYKVRASQSEVYISRVKEGQMGSFSHAGKDYQLRVSKVFPEVNGGRFDFELVFLEKNLPPTITRGLNLQIKLALSEASEARIIPRGSFFNTTGGNWIFVLNEDGTKATRRDIRLGRQNVRQYELLEGLASGERVVTSNYEAYKKIDELIIGD
ncbi:MAG: efflux RND transporter periplasmic adaptor subunit [Bacteroidia bacterium]